MTAWHHYTELDTSVQTRTDWTGEHVTSRFVIVAMTDETCRLDTAVCPLTLHEARRIAVELLAIVESAEAANARSER